MVIISLFFSNVNRNEPLNLIYFCYFFTYGDYFFTLLNTNINDVLHLILYCYLFIYDDYILHKWSFISNLLLVWSITVDNLNYLGQKVAYDKKKRKKIIKRKKRKENL